MIISNRVIKATLLKEKIVVDEITPLQKGKFYRLKSTDNKCYFLKIQESNRIIIEIDSINLLYRIIGFDNLPTLICYGIVQNQGFIVYDYIPNQSASIFSELFNANFEVVSKIFDIITPCYLKFKGMDTINFSTERYLKVAKLPNDKRQLIMSIFEVLDCYFKDKKLPYGYIHGDLHTANILVRKNEITIIDPMTSIHGCFLFDFALLEISLLHHLGNSKFGGSFQKEQYQEIFTNISLGYCNNVLQSDSYIIQSIKTLRTSLSKLIFKYKYDTILITEAYVYFLCCILLRQIGKGNYPVKFRYYVIEQLIFICKNNTIEEQSIYAYLRQTQPASPTQPQTTQMLPIG